MIAAKIDKEIYDHLAITGRDVSVIIMHPKTAVELRNESMGEMKLEIDKLEVSNIYYKGYPVYRSFDIERNEIKVY